MRRYFPLLTQTKLFLQTQSPQLKLSPWEINIFRFLRRVAVATSSNRSPELRVVGGWVRDKLLGTHTGDIDIAVRYATGFQFASRLHVFALEKKNTNYAHHTAADHLPRYGCAEYIPHLSSVGVIAANPAMSRHLETATVRLDGNDLDFVQLRTEDYVLNSTNRIPHNVEVGTPEQDAHRRDFTVNALFYNLHTDTIEDLTGHGLKDLRDGVLRTPLDATVTLLEDPLRAVRAIRFTCRLQFTLHHTLKEALSDTHVHESLMRKVSRERIGNEIVQVIQSEEAFRGLRMISEHGLIQPIFLHSFSSKSGITDTNYDEGLKRVQCALSVLRSVEDLMIQHSLVVCRNTLIMAALIWDASRVRFMLHDALRLAKRLQIDVRKVILLSTKLQHAVGKWYSVSANEKNEEAEEKAWVEVAEIIREAGEPLWIAVCITSGMRAENDKVIVDLVQAGISADLCHMKHAVNGRRIVRELGIPPGPQVGKALQELMRLQLLHHRRRLRSGEGAICSDEGGPSADVCMNLLKAAHLSASHGNGK